MLEKCKTSGLIPFSKQSRNAFISKKILISLVDNNILSKSSYFKILSKLKTVSHYFISDQNKEKEVVGDPDTINQKQKQTQKEKYKIFTTEFDEVANAEDLENQDEMAND